MKAYVLEGINQLEYKEIDKPQLSTGYVLVEVQAAGICGSDIPRIFTTGTYHFPTIPGHEFSGKVVEAFDESGAPWVGKRVGIFPLIPCKECSSCQKESYELCSNYNYLGSRCDGGFAEYVAVPVWNLIELPEKVSFREAAMLEPSSVALHAVRRLDLSEVNSVALFGLGTIGIIIAQWLHIYGIKTVITTGHSSQHGAVMQQVTSSDYVYVDTAKSDNMSRGSDDDRNRSSDSVVETIMKLTNGAGVDAVLDCVATAESLADALSCVKPAGQVVIVGNPKGDIPIDKNTYWKILRKQIRLTGTWNSSFTHTLEDDWNMVLQECAKGKLHLKELITHSLPFDELYQGLVIMRDKLEYRNKVMIVK